MHRLRDAVENGWPQPLQLDEYSHAGLAASYAAGASGLPFGTLRAFQGTDLPATNPNIRSVTCPFTGEMLAAVPAIRPDVTIIHAQQADRRGNVRIRGIVGVQREAVLAAHVAIVTPNVLRGLLQHPLTDRGLDRFLGDISRRPKPRRAR